MNGITTQYIAGLIDGDGSFTLQVGFRKWKDGRVGLGLNPRVQIGFNHRPKEEQVLNEVQKFFGAGKVYFSNKGKVNAKIVYWTTNVDDTIKVCEEIVPYLIIKREQGIKLLEATKFIRNKNLLTRNRFKLKGIYLYTKEEYKKLIEIAVSMNTGTQINRFRKANGRNLDYYLKVLDTMYEKRPI